MNVFQKREPFYHQTTFLQYWGLYPILITFWLVQQGSIFKRMNCKIWLSAIFFESRQLSCYANIKNYRNAFCMQKMPRNNQFQHRFKDDSGPDHIWNSPNSNLSDFWLKSQSSQCFEKSIEPWCTKLVGLKWFNHRIQTKFNSYSFPKRCTCLISQS